MGVSDELKEWLKSEMGYESSNVLNALEAEDIETKEHLLELFVDVKDKLPMRAQKKLQSAMALAPFSFNPPEKESLQKVNLCWWSLCSWGEVATTKVLRLQKAIAQVPIINLLVDMLGGWNPPPFEALKGAMEAIGLLSALLLTVVMSFPGSVSFDELEAVQERFNNEPYNAFKNHKTGGDTHAGSRILNQFAANCITSSMLLGSSVIVAVCLLIFTHTTGCRYYTDNYAAYTKWYQWARWVVFWCFVSMVIGIITCFTAFRGLVHIKFVDLYIETREEDKQGELSGADSPYNYVYTLGHFLLAGSALACVLFLGFGLRIMVITVDKKLSAKVAPDPSVEKNAEKK